MQQQINEELRQYKLARIQEGEIRNERFQAAYDQIRESVIIKVSKNASSNIFRIASGLISFFTFLIGISFIFPQSLNEFFNLSVWPEYEGMLNEAKGVAYFFFIVSSVFFLIGYLLKVNNRERTQLYSVSILLEEVMEYLKTSTEEEKRKYEFFLDHFAELENNQLNNPHVKADQRI